jgi:hypothetical protein
MTRWRFTRLRPLSRAPMGNLDLMEKPSDKAPQLFVGRPGGEGVGIKSVGVATASDGKEQPHVHLMFSDRQQDGIERGPEQFSKRYNAKNPERGGAQKFSNDVDKEEAAPKSDPGYPIRTFLFGRA